MTATSTVNRPRAAALYREMVAAIRAYVLEARPDTNLIDLTAFTPDGAQVGDYLARFHLDPDGDGPHDECDGDGTRRACHHCRGSRRAEAPR